MLLRHIADIANVFLDIVNEMPDIANVSLDIVDEFPDIASGPRFQCYIIF